MILLQATALKSAVSLRYVLTKATLYHLSFEHFYPCDCRELFMHTITGLPTDVSFLLPAIVKLCIHLGNGIFSPSEGFAKDTF
jgi:hypothetical protein